MCLTFSYPSQLKHLLLRAFLAGNLPKKLSKLGVLDERGMKKSKNHCTIVRSEQFLLKSKTYIYIYIYKMRDLEFIHGFPRFRQFPGNDVAARCSEPPFPTHGGQDDGSYTNSLK